jgi:RNA polymerase sporulation-specific sigma factor
VASAEGLSGGAETSAWGRIPDLDAAACLAGVEDSVVVEQVLAAIERLPQRERQILRASFLREEEPRRIAGELRISLSHFYRLQKQALQRIQEHLMPSMLEMQAQE